MARWQSLLWMCPQQGEIPDCQVFGTELSTWAMLGSLTGIGLISLLILSMKSLRWLIVKSIRRGGHYIAWRFFRQPRYFNVPKAIRNVHGRSAELEAIRQLLFGNSRLAITGRTAAISALGGMGKTTIVEEYARTFKTSYDGVWMFSASSKSAMVKSIAALGQEISKPIASSDTLPEASRKVFTSLARNERWLLIFDDASDPSIMEECLRYVSGHHVLITSRYRDWKNVADSFEVEILSETAAVDLLTDEAQHQDKASRRLAVEVLGGLPLSLVVAGGYLRRTGISAEDYIVHISDRLEDAPFNDPYRNSIFSVVAQSSRSVSENAFHLLKLIAFLPKSPIEPIQLGRAILCESENPIWNSLGKENRNLVDLLRDPVGLKVAFSELSLYSLIAEKKAISRWHGSMLEKPAVQYEVHQMTQAVLIEMLNPQERTELADVAAVLASGLLPKDPGLQFYAHIWDRYEELAPHALNLLRLTDYLSVDQLYTAARICNDAGLYFRYVIADFERAFELFESSYMLSCKQNGPEHEDTTKALSNMAEVMGELGLDAQSENAFLEVISIRKDRLGPNHKSIAFSHNNYGEFLQKRDRLPEAIFHFGKAVKVRERNQMHSDPLTIMSRSNLALAKALNAAATKNQLGLKKAFDGANEALRQIRSVAEPNPLGEAVCIERLGRISALLADVNKAIELEKDSLRILVGHYGPSHPDVWHGRELLTSHYKAAGLSAAQANARSVEFVAQCASD